MAVSRTQRQHQIAALLDTKAVASQEELLRLLKAGGVRVTQATLSRDLQELGAVRTRLSNQRWKYVIQASADQIAPEDYLRRVLSDWVGKIEYSKNVIVVHTPPGSAHLVGSAIDRAGIDGVLGTVAGDDTLLTVVSESASTSKLALKLSKLAGI